MKNKNEMTEIDTFDLFSNSVQNYEWSTYVWRNLYSHQYGNGDSWKGHQDDYEHVWTVFILYTCMRRYMLWCYDGAIPY